MGHIKQLDRLAAKFPTVASIFKEHWQTPLQGYSSLLYRVGEGNFEEELKKAFLDEWSGSGLLFSEAEKLLQHLEQRPVLQTSHHVTPTNGPTFLAIDLVSTAGLSDSETYLVAANSGVAFSNTAWSGALSFGDISLNSLLNETSPAYQKALKSARDRQTDGKSDSRISLIPAKHRDQLVYGSRVFHQVIQLFDQFTPQLQECLSPPREEQWYSHWACQTCSKIQEKILDKHKVFFFDINRVISNYMIQVLSQQKEHPLVELLFSDRVNREFNQAFQSPQLFLGAYQSKKSVKIEGFSWVDNGLLSDKREPKRLTKKELIDMLQEGTLCPGIFLQFFILKFMNGIKCLGSFYQIEYLEDFRNHWLDMNPQWKLNLEPEGETSLTTGRLLKDGKAVWPLDLAVRDETIHLEELAGQPMSVLWEPIVTQLAG